MRYQSIQQVIFPDGRSMTPGTLLSIALVTEDDKEPWIVVSKDGWELERHNPRYVQSIIFYSRPEEP